MELLEDVTNWLTGRRHLNLYNCFSLPTMLVQLTGNNMTIKRKKYTGKKSQEKSCNHSKEQNTTQGIHSSTRPGGKARRQHLVLNKTRMGGIEISRRILFHRTGTMKDKMYFLGSIKGCGLIHETWMKWIILIPLQVGFRLRCGSKVHKLHLLHGLPLNQRMWEGSKLFSSAIIQQCLPLVLKGSKHFFLQQREGLG